MKGNFAAIVLVLLGTFFLLNNLGMIDISLLHLLKIWWPLILIVVGVMLFFSPKREPENEGTRQFRGLGLLHRAWAYVPRLPPAASAMRLQSGTSTAGRWHGAGLA